ncbi:MAG: protein kinase family protein, partial [Dehalococcoidia bacterium]
LEDYLERDPPGLELGLRWSIELCHGMEYAFSQGVQAHRDLKPANVLIDGTNTAKVSDLGLAGIAHASTEARSPQEPAVRHASADLGRTQAGAAMGTLTHMAPEQFIDAARCDERSDIYSFGVVLYQLASGGSLPFLAPVHGAPADPRVQLKWTSAMRSLHSDAPIPHIDSPFASIIARCLAKAPGDRYQSFAEVRRYLEDLREQTTGEPATQATRWDLQPIEWHNRGASLAAMGRTDEALECYRRAVELDSSLAKPWHNMAHILMEQKNYEQALQYFDKAIEVGSESESWNDKGMALWALQRFDQALQCFDEAARSDPNYGLPWRNKGTVLELLDQSSNADLSYREAIARNPRDAEAWRLRGNLLGRMGKFPEAAQCFQVLTQLNESDADAWRMSGVAQENAGDLAEAISCYGRAVRLNPNDAGTWYALAVSQQRLGHMAEAAASLQTCVALDPSHAHAWTNLGGCLNELGRSKDGLRSLQHALVLEPRDPIAWWHKAQCEIALSRTSDAVAYLKQVLVLSAAAPELVDAAQIQLRTLDRS